MVRPLWKTETIQTVQQVIVVKSTVLRLQSSTSYRKWELGIRRSLFSNKMVYCFYGNLTIFVIIF